MVCASERYKGADRACFDQRQHVLFSRHQSQSLEDGHANATRVLLRVAVRAQGVTGRDALRLLPVIVENEIIRVGHPHCTTTIGDEVQRVQLQEK